MSNRKRYAIVTPYYREDRSLLERCIRSVQAQTVPADHFLIADGFPQDWIDNEAVRHLKLDHNHADYGNTPRTMGALMAVSEGYQGIGFLDADNWFETNHIAGCMAASLRNEACDYVIAQRNLCRPDGSVINVVEDEPISVHVDTNCFFLLPGSYHVIPHFSLVPVEMSQFGDRIFYLSLQARKLNAEIAPGKTVNYHCLWEAIYHAIGETPPPDAKKSIACRPIKDWLNLQDARQLEIIYRRCGCNIDFEIPPVTQDGHVTLSLKERGAGSQNVKFQQARQLHQNGKVEDAALLYQEILAEDPAEPDALHFFGVLHAQRGDYETAADLIGRSIAVNPYNAIAHYNHGKALRDANRHEDALTSYDRAIALMPSNVDAWSNRGIILQELGRSSEAVESFDRALALSPSHGPSLHNRANALRDLSRNDEVIGQP